LESKLYKVDVVVDMIQQGQLLSLAGDEKVLSKLPKGNWIAGTIPYFMGVERGLFSQDLIFVNQLSNLENEFSIREYDSSNIENIADDSYDNGYSIIIIPPFQDVHKDFALKSQNIDNLYNNPILGWVAGMDLNSNDVPKTYNGISLNSYTDKAIAVHVKLPSDKVGRLEIVNIFEQDKKGITIQPLEDGFEIRDCLIDGNRMNFAKYIQDHNIDIKPPLTSSYSGAIINVSFREVGDDVVSLYAPVFKDLEYRLSIPVENYVVDFEKNIPKTNSPIEFSCNCILNYLYGELEGKRIENFTGPITFGEIGYTLLNQTLVYLVIE
jgi:hypothetical protein